MILTALWFRDKNTRLTLNQTRMLASVMSLTGGMILVSDDLALLQGDRLKLLKQAFDLHKLCARHTPIPVDLMEHHFPGALYNPAGFLGVWNPTDRPQRLLLSLPPGVSEKSLLRAKNYWDGSSFAWEMQGKHLSLAMAPFESAVAVL